MVKRLILLKLQQAFGFDSSSVTDKPKYINVYNFFHVCQIVQLLRKLQKINVM